MTTVRQWAVGHAVDLAALRIVVSLVVLFSADVWDASRWASAATAAPPGWVAVSALLPPSPGAARLALSVVLVGTTLTALGVLTRWASAVAALALVWLLGVPQHVGPVLHTHHLVWFMALVASGPSGDAWSVDAWRGRATASPPSLAYGVPVRAVWLSLGLVYFFPGFFKALEGTAWLDGLARLVAWKRFHAGLEPLALPAVVVKAGGVATVLFELAAPVLFSLRRLRPVGAVVAVGFHAAVQAVLGIHFSSLAVFFVAFVPWHRWFSSGPPARPTSARAAVVPLLMAGALLIAQVVTGFAGLERAWPVACFPRFIGPAPVEVAWVELESDAGWAFTLDDLRAEPTQRRWALSMRVAAEPTESRVRGFVTQGLGRPLRANERVRWTVQSVRLETGLQRAGPSGIVSGTP
ncbi:MAG: HTTM domain-containing protein [Myxococcaceae bacterium]|nr:HTTM domain-containing protein [Myxococcaceae bacterium]